VALDKPNNQRVTVVWNGDGPLSSTPQMGTAPVQPPGGQLVTIPRRGSGAARAIDKRGNSYPYFQVQGAVYLVYLAPATATYYGDPQGYHFIGGDPVIILEDGVDPRQPVNPPGLVSPVSVTPVPGLTPIPGPGVTTQPGTGGSFRMVVNPDGLTIAQGEAADFTLSTQPVDGFSGPIALRVVEWSTQRFPTPADPGSLPIQVSMPASVNAGQSTRIRLDTGQGGVEEGIYYVRIEGSARGLVTYVDVALVVDPYAGGVT
jgi:hypothetical protein